MFALCSLHQVAVSTRYIFATKASLDAMIAQAQYTIAFSLALHQTCRTGCLLARFTKPDVTIITYLSQAFLTLARTVAARDGVAVVADSRT